MHKKSVEAAATLETEEVASGTEQKSGSIVALRARAKEHHSQLANVLGVEDATLSTTEDNFNFKDL